MPSFGLIVEGPGDVEAFSKLVPRTDTPGSAIHALDCGGKSKLMSIFPVLLDQFRHCHNGGPVDKALIIRDSDRRAMDDVLAEMERRLGNRTYPFPVELCVVRRCLDTWLLADHNAVSTVALRRGGRAVAPVNGDLEEIQNAKERFMKMLSEGRLPYTPAVLGEIAEVVDLATLRYRLRSFTNFENMVNAGL